MERDREETRRSPSLDIERVTSSCERRRADGCSDRRAVGARAGAARPDAGDRARPPPPAGREAARADRLDPRAPCARACRRSGSAPQGAPPSWNDRRVLIFTENREGTKRYLQTILEQAIAGTDRAEERIAVITGLTSGRDARRSSGASTPTRPRIRCGS